MKRSGKIAVLTAFAGLLLSLGALFAGAPRAGAESLSALERQAHESVLRLAELPTGYVLGGNFCGAARRPSEEEELVAVGEEHKPPTPYEAFVDHNASDSCVYAYEQLYRPAGAPAEPKVVFSFTFATTSVAAATEALADSGLSKELAAHTIADKVVEEGLYPVGSPPALGEGSRRFHTDLFYWEGHSHMAGTVVLWRQGKLVAGILAGGAKPGVNDAAADRYAALQQKAVEAPRPYEEAEAEDIPTFLGNPNLGVPVYWLGKEFKGGPRGWTSYFVRADARESLAHPETGRRMSIQYDTELFLDSWTPGGWRRFSKTEVGRRQWTWHCTRSQIVRLPEGHAVIYTGYRTDYKTCPSSARQLLSAHVFLPGAVVAIGEPLCRSCEGYLSPQYGSVAAMKALVRGLHRWRPGDAG